MFITKCIVFLGRYILDLEHFCVKSIIYGCSFGKGMSHVSVSTNTFVYKKIPKEEIICRIKRDKSDYPPVDHPSYLMATHIIPPLSLPVPLPLPLDPLRPLPVPPVPLLPFAPLSVSLPISITLSISLPLVRGRVMWPVGGHIWWRDVGGRVGHVCHGGLHAGRRDEGRWRSERAWGKLLDLGRRPALSFRVTWIT